MTLLNQVTTGNPRKLIRPVLQSLFANLISTGPFGLAAAAVGMIYEYYSGPQRAFPAG